MNNLFKYQGKIRYYFHTLERYCVNKAKNSQIIRLNFHILVNQKQIHTHTFIIIIYSDC